MYCYGLEKNVKSIEVVNNPLDFDYNKSKVGERQLSQYLEKMHGRTPQQDLQLAVLWKDDYLHGASKDTKGLAYNYRIEKNSIIADIITWSGELKKEEEIYYYNNHATWNNNSGVGGSKKEQSTEKDFPNFEEATMIFAD